MGVAAGAVCLVMMIVLVTMMIVMIMSVMIVMIVMIVMMHMSLMRSFRPMLVRPERGPHQIGAHQRDQGIAGAFQETGDVTRRRADCRHQEQQRAHDGNG